MMHAPADSGDIDTTCVPDVAHPTALPSAASAVTPAATRPPAGPAGLPVECRVPRKVRDLVDDTALLVYAALAGYARVQTPGTPPVAKARQDTLANLLGVQERTVRRGVEVLRDAGLIRTWRPHQRAATRYELLVVAGGTVRWDEVPRALVRAVQTGTVSRPVVRTWLHLHQALGYAGRTRDNAAQLAARIGVDERTVRRHIRQLAALDLIEVHRRPGIGWTLTLPGHPTMPASVTLPVSAEQGHDMPGQGLPKPVGNPIKPPVTPDTDVRSPRTQMSGPGTAPVNPAPENQLPNLPAVLPQDRQFRNARAAVTSGEPKQKRIGGRQGQAQASGPSGRQNGAGGRRRAPVARVEARTDVAAVLAALPAQWLGGPARRWRPGIAAAVAVALEAGAPVPAVVRAVTELGDLDGTGGRHVLAVRGALATLRADLRLGLACIGCGDPLDSPQMPCGSCTGSDGPTSPVGGRTAIGPILDVDPKRLDDKPDRPVRSRARFDHGPIDDQNGPDGPSDELPVAVRIAAYTDLGLSGADVDDLGDHYAAQLMATTATDTVTVTSDQAPTARTIPDATRTAPVAGVALAAGSDRGPASGSNLRPSPNPAGSPTNAVDGSPGGTGGHRGLVLARACA